MYCRMHNPFQNSYPGLRIHAIGWLKKGSDVVIPPHLFVAADYPEHYGEAIIQHGYGHYLQYKKYGPLKYYMVIAPRSIQAAIQRNDFEAVEIEANILAHEFFGEKSLMGGKHFPLV